MANQVVLGKDVEIIIRKYLETYCVDVANCPYAEDWLYAGELTCLISVGATAGEIAAYFCEASHITHIKTKSWHEVEKSIEQVKRKFENDIPHILLVSSGADAEVPKDLEAGTLFSRTDIVLGLVVGRTEEATIWGLAKAFHVHDIPDGKDSTALLLAPYFWGKSAQSRYLAEESMNCEADDLIVPKNINLAVVAGHGRADHIGVGDTPVCGAAEICSLMLDSSNDTGHIPRLPQCAFGHGCFLSGRPVPITSIQAELLVLYSCTSGHVGSDMYEQQYDIGLSALEGYPQAVIATSRPIVDDGWEAGFLVSLLRSGVSTGEAVRELNYLYQYEKGVPGGFMVLGNPNVRMNASYAKVSIRDKQIVIVSKGDAFKVTIGPDEHIFSSDLRVGAANVSNDDYVVWRIGGFKDGDSLEIRKIEDDLSHLSKSTQCFRQNLNMMNTQIPDIVLSRIKEDQRISESISSAQRLAPFIPARANELQGLHKRRFANLCKADRDLALAAAHRSISGDQFDIEDYFEEKYTPLLSNQNDSVCLCGRRCQTLLYREAVTGNRVVVRSCMQCGEAWWLPDASPLNGIEWKALEFVGENKTLSMDITVHSNKTYAVDVALALWMSSRYGGHPSSDKPVYQNVVESEGSYSFKCIWDVSGLLPHRYFLCAAIVANGVPSVFRKFIQIVPERNEEI